MLIRDFNPDIYIVFCLIFMFNLYIHLKLYTYSAIYIISIICLNWKNTFF